MTDQQLEEVITTVYAGLCYVSYGVVFAMGTSSICTCSWSVGREVAGLGC